MSKTHSPETPKLPLDRQELIGWEFVPVGDYTPPTFEGLSRAVRKWTALKSLLRSPREESLTPARTEADLRALPRVRLENLAPPIDWESAATALDVALSDWLEADDPEPAVCFLIGQPWCGHGEILEKWAAMRDAEVIAAPSSLEILQGEPDWLRKWGTNQRLWVLPRLERCYLRHVDGLTLVRAVLERAAGGDLGRGVIGCDSWAWAYLQRVWPLAQPKTLTIQAFDGDRLTRLFACPAKQGASRHARICHAKTGTPIIPSWEEITQGDYVVGKELKQLAAHCRGNPGTAWAYWRNRLRSEPEALENAPENADENALGGPKQGSNDPDTIWFAADMADPAMPMEADEDMAFVLHGLLFHNGLNADALASILPLSQSRIMSILLRLKGCDLVSREEACWRVSALGYATVRGFLRERDYLTDQF